MGAGRGVLTASLKAGHLPLPPGPPSTPPPGISVPLDQTPPSDPKFRRQGLFFAPARQPPRHRLIGSSHYSGLRLPRLGTHGPFVIPDHRPNYSLRKPNPQTCSLIPNRASLCPAGGGHAFCCSQSWQFGRSAAACEPSHAALLPRATPKNRLRFGQFGWRSPHSKHL
jgi:hypothetical protein